MVGNVEKDSYNWKAAVVVTALGGIKSQDF